MGRAGRNDRPVAVVGGVRRALARGGSVPSRRTLAARPIRLRRIGARPGLRCARRTPRFAILAALGFLRRSTGTGPPLANPYSMRVGLCFTLRRRALADSYSARPRVGKGYRHLASLGASPLFHRSPPARAGGTAGRWAFPVPASPSNCSPPPRPIRRHNQKPLVALETSRGDGGPLGYPGSRKPGPRQRKRGQAPRCARSQSPFYPLTAAVRSPPPPSHRCGSGRPRPGSSRKSCRRRPDRCGLWP